jgi:hypothetical protein
MRGTEPLDSAAYMSIQSSLETGNVAANPNANPDYSGPNAVVAQDNDKQQYDIILE